MHLVIAEQGMVTPAEARRDVAVRDRLAYQEFLRALPALVVVVDEIVVAGLIAIEFSGFPTGGQQREQHLRFAVLAGIFVVAGKQDLEGIAGLDPALEVDIVGIDAYEIVDHRARYVIAQPCLVDALIKSNSLAVVVVVAAGGGDSVGVAHIDGHVFAELGPRDHGLDRGVGGDDDAHRPQPYPSLAGASSTRNLYPSR